MANPPTVPEHPMGGRGPLASRQERGYVLLDLVRIGLGRPAKSLREPADMGVHRDARHAERVAKHHIGGLAADTRQSNELFHGAGNLAAEAIAERREIRAAASKA